MTKQVRIENADTSSWPVRVTVQHKNEASEGIAVNFDPAPRDGVLLEQFLAAAKETGITHLNIRPDADSHA